MGPAAARHRPAGRRRRRGGRRPVDPPAPTARRAGLRAGPAVRGLARRCAARRPAPDPTARRARTDRGRRARGPAARGTGPPRRTSRGAGGADGELRAARRRPRTRRPGQRGVSRRVAVVGPGRVGTLLAIALARAGYRVVAVAGGSRDARSAVAAAVAGLRPVDDPADAVRGTDLVVLATPDDAIEPVVTALAAADAFREGQRLVHVAGSRGLAPLRRAGLAGARVAACHPATTVPRGARDPELLVGTTWAVTTAPADRAWAHDLVVDLGGDPVDVADDRRGLYHAALTVGSNAVGAAVVVARQLLLAARVDVPAAFLGPLVERSVANALTDGATALTGPVVRGDVGTVARHLEVLSADVPELADAYRLLSQVLLDRVRAGLSPEAAAELEALLVATGGRPAAGP
ncbi:DUF2520 domain-containing protein [Nitriliruptoraceae bacterium ZYF776]|nr:DUF2520 domain-containing protein [Profundirhabdus halotolerans]